MVPNSVISLLQRSRPVAKHRCAILADYLDIYQLHGASEHDINDDLLLAMQRLRERGLIRHTGINTHSASTLRWMIANPDVFDVVLLDYNALQQDREPLIDQLHNAGIGVLAGTVLAQGHLLPARARLPHLADAWYLARAWLKPSSRALMQCSRNMRNAVASIDSQRPAQTAFAYVLQHPGVASGILGTTRISNLDEVLQTRIHALDAVQRQRLVTAFGDGAALQSLIFTCGGGDCGSLGAMKKPSASLSLSC